MTEDEGKYEKISDEIVEQVLKNFDFDKVKQIMDLFNWEWRSTGVPTVTQIFFTARMLLMKVASGECWATGTGGLYVSRDGEELTLCFQAVSSMVLLDEIDQGGSK